MTTHGKPAFNRGALAICTSEVDTIVFGPHSFVVRAPIMPKPELGVLLDLDQTLVLTEAIEPLRKLRQWARVYQSFGDTHLAVGTQEFVSQVKSIAKVGVVTNSPRVYAERLLAHHRLDIPVLVGYHDVSNHKPHPEAILKAAEIIQIPVQRCIHVGDSAIDIEASVMAGAMTVAVNWSEQNQIRDSRVELAATTWESVLNFVRSKAGAQGIR